MLPCMGILGIVAEGFQFLRGVVTDLQLGNLMMIATTVILYGKFNLSEVQRSWLEKRSLNALSHCLKAAKFRLDDAISAYAKMLHRSYDLKGGRYIIDDTLEHHSAMCKLIYGVQSHRDHVFRRNVKAKCLVFLYYSEGGVIKFPIGWRIYKRGGKHKKHELAFELIEEARGREFPCEVVLCDSLYCVMPFVIRLRSVGLRYIMEARTEKAQIQEPIKRRVENRRGPRRKRR